MKRALLAGALASVLLAGVAHVTRAEETPLSVCGVTAWGSPGETQSPSLLAMWPVARDAERDMLVLMVRRIPGFAQRAGGDFACAELAAQALGGTELRMLRRLSDQARRSADRSGGQAVKAEREEVPAIW